MFGARSERAEPQMGLDEQARSVSYFSFMQQAFPEYLMCIRVRARHSYEKVFEFLVREARPGISQLPHPGLDQQVPDVTRC